MAVSAAGAQVWDAGPQQGSSQGAWEGRSGKGEKKRALGWLLCNRGRVGVVPARTRLRRGVLVTSGHRCLLGPETT